MWSELMNNMSGKKHNYAWAKSAASLLKMNIMEGFSRECSRLQKLWPVFKRVMDYLQCESKDGGVLDLLEVEEESNLPKKTENKKMKK